MARRKRVKVDAPLPEMLKKEPNSVTRQRRQNVSMPLAMKDPKYANQKVTLKTVKTARGYKTGVNLVGKGVVEQNVTLGEAQKIMSAIIRKHRNLLTQTIPVVSIRNNGHTVDFGYTPDKANIDYGKDAGVKTEPDSPAKGLNTDFNVI